MAFTAMQREPFEWSVRGISAGLPPTAEVDIRITGPQSEFLVPAFRSSASEWRVRFAAPEPGVYHWRAQVPNEGIGASDSTTGTLEVLPYQGENELLSRGAIKVSRKGNGFQHADGTPFFWYGDTWWMALTDRLSWPDGFAELTEDRVSKGFTVVQLVAGVYPDMAYGDSRGENEAGLPYDLDLHKPNNGWWDHADLKIAALVRAGIVPCIVGSWGYYATIFGEEAMKRHWRVIIARWSAWPVIWCLAGEAAMPYYLSDTPDQDAATQRTKWAAIGRYVRSVDPMQRLVTIHPTQSGRDQVDDDSVLDFDMLQTGHDGRTAIESTVRLVTESLQKEPPMPVVVGEVIYEGIMHESDAEKLRLAWWAAFLSGASGFTYGANGIWQMNEAGRAYGASPHGRTWGNTPWREAAQLPGARQLGICSRFLRKFDWQQMKPHPEWIEPTQKPDEFARWYAAGVSNSFRLFYFYELVLPWVQSRNPVITDLSPDTQWSGVWFDPRTGTEYPIGTVTPDSEGRWNLPIMPEMRDYVLALVPQSETA
jgi:hypothetical protein